MEARLLQCRNITNPGCQGGLTTRCSVRQGISYFASVKVQTSSEILFGTFFGLLRAPEMAGWEGGPKLWTSPDGLNDPLAEVPLVLLHRDGDRHSAGGQTGLQDGEGGELPGRLLLPPDQGQQVSH